MTDLLVVRIPKDRKSIAIIRERKLPFHVLVGLLTNREIPAIASRPGWW